MRETKGEVLREATIKTYADVWKRYLLPAVGHLTLLQLTVEVVRQVKRDIPPLAVAQRPGSRGAAGSSPIWRSSSSASPWTSPCGWIGSRATWRRPRWCPATRKAAARKSWTPSGYALLGEVVRDLERRPCRGEEIFPSSAVAPGTPGCHLHWRPAPVGSAMDRLEWCRLDDEVPRIGIPRAKGDRGSKVRCRAKQAQLSEDRQERARRVSPASPRSPVRWSLRGPGTSETLLAALWMSGLAVLSLRQREMLSAPCGQWQ